MTRVRIGHRIIRFRWESGLLFRLWPDGPRRIVPRPDQRVSLLRQVHEELGHFRHTHDAFDVAWPILVDWHVSACGCLCQEV